MTGLVMLINPFPVDIYLVGRKLVVFASQLVSRFLGVGSIEFNFKIVVYRGPSNEGIARRAIELELYFSGGWLRWGSNCNPGCLPYPNQSSSVLLLSCLPWLSR